ncbi:hypothetical protein N7G274_008998 [Stereocaulon virgatum]|uniref:Uncharacterized protein n=1 Tax=Stereocaulon virgatum TaxID=373712 RepID=A0ABR3ZYP3_9LECA
MTFPRLQMRDQPRRNPLAMMFENFTAPVQAFHKRCCLSTLANYQLLWEARPILLILLTSQQVPSTLQTYRAHLDPRWSRIGGNLSQASHIALPDVAALNPIFNICGDYLFKAFDPPKDLIHASALTPTAI